MSIRLGKKITQKIIDEKTLAALIPGAPSQPSQTSNPSNWPWICSQPRSLVTMSANFLICAWALN